MAELRYGRGWTTAELEARLVALATVPRSFPESRLDDMAEERGWRPERSESCVGHEAPGPPQPGGLFERARGIVERYAFSDESIVAGHYAAGTPLDGRRMLLEIKVLGLHYLCGVVVACVARQSTDEQTVWGYRYDTLAGHLECGAEWFEVTKLHATGEVRFTIRSWWKNGQFPNWWSRAGFDVLSPYYRSLWLDRAHERVRGIERRQPTFPLAAALGALGGMRSTAPLVVTAWELAAPRATVAAVTAAAGELVFDKLPNVPARISPPALAARVTNGAFAGAMLARHRRGNPWTAAVVGALAAGASAVVTYRARKAIHERTRLASATLGAIEDLFVIAGTVGVAGLIGQRQQRSRSAGTPREAAGADAP